MVSPVQQEDCCKGHTTVIRLYGLVYNNQAKYSVSNFSHYKALSVYLSFVIGENSTGVWSV